MSELILWMDKEINKMKRDMDRLFRESWPEIGVGMLREKVSQPIRVETFMTEKAFIIRAVLPGVDPKDLDISVKDYQLTIKGCKKEDTVDEAGYCKQMARKLRSFYRTVPLPFKAIPEEIKATLNSDILNIQIPRRDLRENRYIKIEIT
jgi:HSP20 family protein